MEALAAVLRTRAGGSEARRSLTAPTAYPIFDHAEFNTSRLWFADFRSIRTTSVVYADSALIRVISSAWSGAHGEIKDTAVQTCFDGALGVGTQFTLSSAYRARRA
ncbi:MAG TPA: hypothetical protein VLA05_05445 [Coriobacteriia bacterium]|nr:hypothetical protein [Coriobacteriia bacterium]